MSLILSETDQAEFLSVYLGLMYYIWLSGDLNLEDETIEAFLEQPDIVREVCRDLIYYEEEVIDNYKAEHEDVLDESALELLDSIYAGLLSEFIILKDTPEYAVLYQMEEKQFYQVVNITGPFREMLPHIPIKIKAGIVDFKGRIVCDGVITNSNKMIATAFINKLNKEYEKAVSAGTVIELLD